MGAIFLRNRKLYNTVMKWTVLSDNRTRSSTLSTEHGLSVYLETDRHRLLLDTGASDVFIRNAEQLGIDLRMVDYVFVSHGHSDHAGGLRHLMEINRSAKVIVSPEAMSSTYVSMRRRIHNLTPSWPDIPAERLLEVMQTCDLGDGIRVIARIPHIHPSPKGNCYLHVQSHDGNLLSDDFRHELALYADGLLFTGCAHSGLENILSACPWPVHTVVGGFHLLDGQETDDELTALATRLTEHYPDTHFHTSHCTGDHAFMVMSQAMNGKLHGFSCGTSGNH